MKYFLFLLTICSFSLSAQTITWDKPGTTTKKTAQTSPAYNRAYNDLQVGNATYYADYLAGRPTAYGETYRPDQLTASHALLPLGTILTVTRLGDGRSVKVRINDNNGHSDGSIVVLSRAAAEQIGMIEVGRTRVSVKRSGFSNWNPQPAQPVQRQLTARGGVTTNTRAAASSTYNSTPAPATYEAPTSRTVYRAPVTRPASDYYQPAPRPQVTDGYVKPTVSNSPDFNDASSPANDPTAYQPATYENRAVAQPSAYSPPVYANRAPQTAKSPAVIGREVPVSNTPAYQPVNRKAQPTAYARANVAPVNEVQVTSNQVQQGYAIQLAAYGNMENAQRQVRSLQNQGVENIYVATVNRADGMTLNRVMVGPFADAATAQRNADELLTRRQINGIVTRLP